jgi:hypothetical protein
MKETFTRKIGPLPMWAWLAIIGTVIVGWAWWRNRQTSSTSANSGTTADASQVPQFVNQTYTTVQPPVPAAPPPIELTDQDTADQDTGKDRDKDRNPTKRPVNRKHPTHHRTTVPPVSGNGGLGGELGVQHVPRGTVHKTPRRPARHHRG